MICIYKGLGERNNNLEKERKREREKKGGVREAKRR